MKLSEYLKKEGHGSAIKLAKKIGATSTEVSHWSSGLRDVPPNRCKKIIEATNCLVTAKDLRPNDWDSYVWPDLSKESPAKEGV